MKTSKLTLILAGAALIAGSTLALAGQPGRGGMRGAGACDGSMRGPGPGGMRGHGQGAGLLGPVGMALHRLDLTGEQRTAIDAILDEARPSFQALHEQLQANREAFRTAHPPATFDEPAVRAHVAQQSAIHADMAVAGGKVRAKVLALLTPEQLAQLEELRKKAEDCAGEWMGHGRGGFGGGPNW